MHLIQIRREPIPSKNFTIKHKVKDDVPVYMKTYRTPHSQKDEIDKQVKKLIKDGIVEPSVPEYNSVLLLVPKK